MSLCFLRSATAVGTFTGKPMVAIRSAARSTRTAKTTVKIFSLITLIASSELLDYKQRLALYRCCSLKAVDAYVSSRCYFAHPNLSNITLGDRVFLNHFCFLENGAAITIGDDSCLGPGVKVLTTTHEIGGHGRRVGNGCIRLPVTIGRGCWIGAGASILPGVAIADGVVVGAGALVTRDCQADGLYVGVPARRVKELSGNLEATFQNSSHELLTQNR